jgi:predicted acyltransferase
MPRSHLCERLFLPQALPAFVRNYALASLSRLVALDAFRGATIALMIIVNNAGGPTSYGPLNHSAWNGWTITDTVFPTFLWIVGVSITLSLGKRVAAGVPRSHLLGPIFRRAAIIFVLGMSIYAFPDLNLSTQRILGVLQRIAICYLIASLIYLYTGIRGQIVWLISLLAVYWLLMTLVPVPGYGAGHLDEAGNFSHYIDTLVLGRHNYGGHTWDPEGIVSTLPSIATALLGIMAGHILRLQRTLSERVTWLFLTGNILIGLGLICDVWLPINKKLWTDSFAIFMAGLDFVLLAGFLWIIDHLGHQRFVKPAVIMGMNAITLYLTSEFGAEILDVTSLHDRFYRLFLTFTSPINASLLYAVAFMLVNYALGYVMYRRGWFLRI